MQVLLFSGLNFVLWLTFGGLLFGLCCRCCYYALMCVDLKLRAQHMIYLSYVAIKTLTQLHFATQVATTEKCSIQFGAFLTCDTRRGKRSKGKAIGKCCQAEIRENKERKESKLIECDLVSCAFAVTLQAILTVC